MSTKTDRACGRSIVRHFREYGVTDYVWQKNLRKRAKLKAVIEGKTTGFTQFIMPSSRDGTLSEGEIRRSGQRFYEKTAGTDFGVCDDFAAGVCYGILMDVDAGRWTGSSAELIQGGGHSYVICNRNAVDPMGSVDRQVNNNTFILDAWHWCLNCCEGDAVISDKTRVKRHLSAFHPSSTPPNGSARPGGISCVLTTTGGVENNAPIRRRCCYITTATCEVMGFDDDCEALSTLRDFRDTVLANSPEGRKDIDAYYRRAPIVVAKLDQRSDKQQCYANIYHSRILPAVALVKQGKNTQAYALYKQMVDELEHLV